MNEKHRIDKQITIEAAVARIPSRCMLALGGMTIYRRPMAFVRALLRRYAQTGEPHDLTLLSFTAGLESELLVGAGMVARVRTCYFGLEIFGLAPMFTLRAGRGEIEIIEETEASIAFGLRATMSSVGFMPGRAWLGTDLPKLRPDVKTVIDPYSGEELMAFPAIVPDVAVIHALQSDMAGNCLIGANRAIDEELAITSRLVVVTAEEIVPELSKADFTAPFVDAVVHMPEGALPTSCHPLYPVDGMAIMEYTSQVSDAESFAKYIARWLE